LIVEGGRASVWNPADGIKDDRCWKC
jgi:hypothetical protein